MAGNQGNTGRIVVEVSTLLWATPYLRLVKITPGHVYGQHNSYDLKLPMKPEVRSIVMQISAPPSLRFLKLTIGTYLVATLGFTQLKTMLTIGGLWRTGVHRTRSIELIPFHDFFRVRGFFNPLFNTMGNLTLFVPLGILLGVWWVMHGRWSSTAGEPVRPVRGAVRRSAVIGFFFSLGIEITQFILGVGYSDISDLLFNTLGAMLGAWLAVKAGVPWHRTLVTACLILAIIGILLLLGVGQWVMDTFSG